METASKAFFVLWIIGLASLTVAFIETWLEVRKVRKVHTSPSSFKALKQALKRAFRRQERGHYLVSIKSDIMLLVQLLNYLEGLERLIGSAEFKRRYPHFVVATEKAKARIKSELQKSS